MSRDPREGVKATTCPTCGSRLDAATGIGEEAEAKGPRPGDFSVCMRCGTFLRFDDECEPQLALESDLAELDQATRATMERAQKVFRRAGRWS